MAFLSIKRYIIGHFCRIRSIKGHRKNNEEARSLELEFLFLECLLKFSVYLFSSQPTGEDCAVGGEENIGGNGGDDGFLVHFTSKISSSFVFSSFLSKSVEITVPSGAMRTKVGTPVMPYFSEAEVRLPCEARVSRSCSHGS